MSNLLSKFIIKKKTGDVVHTSAYAEAQNSGGIGTASTQSFNDRMQIEKNRSKVRGYNDSRVVVQARVDSGVRAKVYTPPEDKNSFMEKRNGMEIVQDRVGVKQNETDAVQNRKIALKVTGSSAKPASPRVENTRPLIKPQIQPSFMKKK